MEDGTGAPGGLRRESHNPVRRAARMNALDTLRGAERGAEPAGGAEIEHAVAGAGIEQEVERRRLSRDRDLHPDHARARLERNFRRGEGGVGED